MGRAEPLRSNSTSTNSLFSLHRSSYSSIIDHYCEEEEESQETQLEQPLPHPIVTTAITSQDEEATPITPSQSPLTLNYRSRHRSVWLHQQNDSHRDKFVVVLIGLPATGKSTISNHLIQFLKSSPSTAHLRCSIFNAGHVRRKLSCKGRPMMLANNSSEDLFNPKNSEKKEKYARITLEKLFNELDMDLCDVAIFDATNSTEKRRNFIFEGIRAYNSNKRGQQFQITPIALQVTCSDKEFIKYNIHNKTFNQDYFDKPYEFAVQDFGKRLKHYYSQFVPLNKREFEHYLFDGTLSQDNSGLFFFNIINAGLLDTRELNCFHFPSQYSNAVGEVVNAFEYFVEHYAQMYGFQYIERAKQFINGTATVTQGDSRNVTNSSRIPYLAKLNEVINEEYFNCLHQTA